MRRKDREITDFDEIIKIIRKCDTIRLAINDEDYPYIVALNFGMEVVDGQIFFYLHSALKGKKIDLLKKDNRVSFEMDTDHIFIMKEEKMSCTMGYESVTGRGRIEFLKEEEKFEALKILMAKYHQEDFEFNTKLIPATNVMRLKVENIWAKRRNNRENMNKGDKFSVQED